MNTQLLPPNLPSTASPIHHCCLFQNSQTVTQEQRQYDKKKHNTNAEKKIKTLILNSCPRNTHQRHHQFTTAACNNHRHTLHHQRQKTQNTDTNTKTFALCLNCLCLNIHLTQSNLYWSHYVSTVHFLRFFEVWLCVAYSVLVRLWDCAAHSVRLHTTLFSAEWLRLYLYVSPPFCPH